MTSSSPRQQSTKTDPDFARRQMIAQVAMEILRSKDANAERQLDEKCSDPELRERVRSFLRHYAERQGSFLEPDVWVRATVQHVDPRSLLGTQIGRYKLLELIGGGGMGDVFRAEHVEMKKAVAIKLITPRIPLTPANIQTFRKEWEASGKLIHENIVLALDAGHSDGQYYLVMEWLEGTDLSRLIKLDGPLRIETACQLLAEAARGLSHIHSVGMVHRDVKPSNIFLTKSGAVKLLDLGIASTTIEPALEEIGHRDMSICGTLDYMPPEQWDQSTRVTSSADIYALGCTFYELLEGHPPFASERHLDLFSKLAAHRSEQVPLDGLRCGPLPAPVFELLALMLHKEPLKRPSAAQVVVSLESFLGRTGSTSVASLRKRNPRRAQSDMEQLVPRWGQCLVVGDTLQMCEYHQDRADVRLFEQREPDEIVEEHGSRIRIKRTPSLVALVGQMQHKTECAGHWGLMTGERDWLVANVQRFIRHYPATTNACVRVLQCGIAGHVHFLGNATLILRALRGASAQAQVQIVTVDRCPGPLLTSKALLAAIESDSPAPGIDDPWELSAGGHSLIVDDSLRRPIRILKGGLSQLSFEFATLDVTAPGELSCLAPVHVVLAHFLLNMWGTDALERVRRWGAEISKLIVTGGELLLAIDPAILPPSADVVSIRGILASQNLVCEEELAVWDLYDLDFKTRKDFLESGDDLHVVRESQLLRFVKRCDGSVPH